MVLAPLELPLTSCPPITRLCNEPFFLKGNPHSPHAKHGVLLLHGLGGGIYEMHPLAEYLNELGFTVLGQNYPGHDKLVDHMPKSTWQQWYACVNDGYGQLLDCCDKVSVVALSTGCPLALKLAYEFQHTEAPVHQLVMLSPFFKIQYNWYHVVPLEWLARPISWFTHVVPRMSFPIADPEICALAEEACYMKSFNVAAVRSALELIQQVKPVLPHIHAPALILQPHRDRVVHTSGAEMLYKTLGTKAEKAGNKSLLWLKRSNHVITLDYERAEVFAHTAQFLQSGVPYGWVKE